MITLDFVWPHLFFTTVSTNDAVGERVFVVLLLVVAHVTGVRLAAAREPEPPVAVLVMAACAPLGKWMTFFY